MRLLVTGAPGLVGRAVLCTARATRHSVTGLARSDVDITDSVAVERAVEQAQPDIVVNAAAYTDVDAAEDDSLRAMAVNRDGPLHLAQAALRVGARLIHISTDYVFDGRQQTPYRESDPARPLSVYGWSKLAGERAVLRAHPRALVVRTSWVFGAGGGGFLSRLPERLTDGNGALRVLADETGTPTFVRDLARAIVRLAASDASGVIHVAGQPAATRYDVARALARRLRERGERATDPVPVCGDAIGPRAARRPIQSALDCSRYESLMRHPVGRWQDALTELVASDHSGQEVLSNR